MSNLSPVSLFTLLVAPVFIGIIYKFIKDQQRGIVWKSFYGIPRGKFNKTTQQLAEAWVMIAIVVTLVYLVYYLLKSH